MYLLVSKSDRTDQVEKQYDDLYDDLIIRIDTIVLSGYALPD